MTGSVVTMNDLLELEVGDFFRYSHVGASGRWMEVMHPPEPDLSTTGGPLPAVLVGVYFGGAKAWCYVNVREGSEIQVQEKGRVPRHDDG